MPKLFTYVIMLIAVLLFPRGQEQWAQCDDCSKWRRLPFDVLLPPKWTCAENVWDLSRSQYIKFQISLICFAVYLKLICRHKDDISICISRCSCSAPDELGPKELDQLVKVNKGITLPLPKYMEVGTKQKNRGTYLNCWNLLQSMF